MKYCQKCGNQIPDSAVFCDKCGAKQEQVSSAPAQSIPYDASTLRGRQGAAIKSFRYSGDVTANRILAFFVLAFSVLCGVVGVGELITAFKAGQNFFAFAPAAGFFLIGAAALFFLFIRLMIKSARVSKYEYHVKERGISGVERNGEQFEFQYADVTALEKTSTNLKVTTKDGSEYNMYVRNKNCEYMMRIIQENCPNQPEVKRNF